MKAIIIFVAAIFIFTIIFFLAQLMSESYYGLSDVNILNFENFEEELFSAAIIALCTAVGIFSKHMYDLLSNVSQSATGYTTFSALLKSVALSLLLCPIVVGSFVEELKQIGSPIFAMVFAYQNGFFFQTIFQPKKQVGVADDTVH